MTSALSLSQRAVLAKQHRLYKVQKDPLACVSPCFVPSGNYTGNNMKTARDGANDHFLYLAKGGSV